MSDDTRTCNRCNITAPYEGQTWLWLSQPFGNESGFYLCEKCSIAEWPCPIRLVFHIGVPEWARTCIASADFLQKLRAWFGEHSVAPVEDFVIHYFHRREAERLKWMHQWDPNREHTPVAPYSYRGWCGRMMLGTKPTLKSVS